MMPVTGSRSVVNDDHSASIRADRFATLVRAPLAAVLLALALMVIAPVAARASGVQTGPQGIAVNSSGDVYVSDWAHNTVDEITPQGVSIVAGIPGQSGAPTPGPATDSLLDDTIGLAVSKAGDLYIDDLGNDVIEKVTPSGTLSIFAGELAASGEPTPGPATDSMLNYPQGVAVDGAGNLPKQLPSRLTTLQKACTQAQFKANPAGCPAASLIGTAKAITPILPVPLEGPVYFVSNGGEAFPNLIMVLQGDGVTIDLVGDTFISKSGITSSTFKTVPDQPVQSFELTLPEGKFSALTANANLCTVKGGLKMPTEFKAQNGAEIKQDTKIAVTGCPSKISIESKNVSGKKTTLTVYVPAAGKLTASGKGVTSETKTYSGQEAQTFTLTQKKAGKLKTKIKLTFTPSKGKDRKKQVKSIDITFKK